MIFSISTIIFILLNTYCKINNRKRFYIITVITFAILAFFVVPKEGTDLYGYFTMMDRIRNLDFNQTVLLYSSELSGMPVYAAFFYVISKLGIKQIALVLAYISVYGSQLALVHMIASDNEYSDSEEKWGYLFVMMLTNAYALTGIRNMMAFALFAFFLYIDVVRKQKRVFCIIVYIALCLFHSSVIVLVLLRVLLLIPEGKISRVLKLSIVLWPLLLNKIGDILSGLNGQFWSTLTHKFFIYTEDAQAVWLGGTMGLIRLYSRVFIVVLILIILFLDRTAENEVAKFVSYYKYVAYFAIGSMAVPIVATRYVPMAIFLAAPLYPRVRCAYTESEGNTDILKCVKMLMIFTTLLYFYVMITTQYNNLF